MAISGQSFIDSNRIHIHNLKEAEDFLESYGFSLQDPIDAQEIETIRQEAIQLLQTELLLEGESIPKVVLEETDVRQLLVNATGLGTKRSGPWSGALLRVMHTLVHCHSHLNDLYHNEIREQILERFQPHISETQHKFFLGDIPLTKFELRMAKSRLSVAMKLMHKAENVATDIFDWIGLRFITDYRADVLNVLAYLRTHNIIAYANIKPSRSRNTLINLAWIDQCLQQGMTIDDIKQKMQGEGYPTAVEQRSDNPFSGVSYHSVQITSRQRIKIMQPHGERLCFYFPFEIQLMDRESYLKTREGLASHKEYKQRQREAVRKRVLPFLYKHNL